MSQDDMKLEIFPMRCSAYDADGSSLFSLSTNRQKKNKTRQTRQDRQDKTDKTKQTKQNKTEED
jgi:hypothetical protein